MTRAAIVLTLLGSASAAFAADPPLGSLWGRREVQLGAGRPRATVVSILADPMLSRDLHEHLAGRGVAARVVHAPFRYGFMKPTLEALRHEIAQIEGPVILAGYSFGGRVAMRLAHELPAGKVSGMLLMSPQVKANHAAWKRAFGTDLPDHQTFVARGGPHLAQTDFGLYDEHAQERNIKIPTLIFHGDQDFAVSPHYVRRVAEDPSNTGAKLYLYAGQSHGFNGPSSRHIARAVSDLIAGQHQPGPGRVEIVEP